VKVEFENPQRAIHDLTIEDSDGKQVGQTYVLSRSWDSTFVNLKPGTYTFYCSVTGHREAGMEGTLTVE
jgi:plastocyanin